MEVKKKVVIDGLSGIVGLVRDSSSTDNLLERKLFVHLFRISDISALLM